MMKCPKTNKVLTVLLVLCLLLSLVPVIGHAADVDENGVHSGGMTESLEIKSGTKMKAAGKRSLDILRTEAEGSEYLTIRNKVRNAKKTYSDSVAITEATLYNFVSTDEQVLGDIYVGGIPLRHGEYLDTEGNVSTTQPEGGYAYCVSKGGDDRTVVTLTLHNYTYTGIGMGTSEDYSGAIFAPYSTTMILEGDNIFTAESSDTYYTLGVHAWDHLIIKGTGSLDFAVDKDTFYDCAVFAEHGMTVISGTINCTAADYGVYVGYYMFINGGTVTAVGIYEGICAVGDLTINGGTITAASSAEGIYVESDLKITGGIASIYSEENDAVYIYEGNLTISGGKFTAATDNSETFYGIYLNNGCTEVNGGTLEVLNGGIYSVGYIYLGDGISVVSPVGGYAHECKSVYNSSDRIAEAFIINDGGLLGDLDLDGDVDSDDLTKLARHVGGIEPAEGQALLNADVTGDGAVNSDDLTKHARYVGGIITSWDQT